MPNTWESEGYVLDVFVDSKRVSVKAYDRHGKFVGRASFIKGPDFIEADDSDGINSVFVHPAHRRKGLASAMYLLAEERSGIKVIPSENQSGAGELFWEAFISFLPDNHPAWEWIGE